MKKKMVFVFLLVIVAVGAFAQKSESFLESVRVDDVSKTENYYFTVEHWTSGNEEHVTLSLKDGRTEQFVFTPLPSFANMYSAVVQAGGFTLRGAAHKSRSDDNTYWTVTLPFSNGTSGSIVFGYFPMP